MRLLSLLIFNRCDVATYTYVRTCTVCIKGGEMVTLASFQLSQFCIVRCRTSREFFFFYRVFKSREWWPKGFRGAALLVDSISWIQSDTFGVFHAVWRRIWTTDVTSLTTIDTLQAVFRLFWYLSVGTPEIWHLSKLIEHSEHDRWEISSSRNDFQNVVHRVF